MIDLGSQASLKLPARPSLPTGTTYASSSTHTAALQVWKAMRDNKYIIAHVFSATACAHATASYRAAPHTHRRRCGMRPAAKLAEGGKASGGKMDAAEVCKLLVCLAGAHTLCIWHGSPAAAAALCRS